MLYSLGGITVICDAGGCAGNICGFDEPRWLTEKSAIYSAGLRDMDAILGRDDRLVEKLKRTVASVGTENVSFAAIIGTPVPSVIATDYQALKRMCERRIEIHTLCIDTTGMELYDAGAEKAYMELFRSYLDTDAPVPAGAAAYEGPISSAEIKDYTGYTGVLGATPLDTGMNKVKDFFSKALDTDKLCCFCLGDGIAAIRQAGSMSRNIVIAPSALRLAEYLKQSFGTPYEIYYPGADLLLAGALKNRDSDNSGLQLHDKRVLIIHQHVLALSLAKLIEAYGPKSVKTASWFKLVPDMDGIHLHDEGDLTELINKFNPDIIISDRIIEPLVRASGSNALIIDMPHFAVSGRML